VTECAVADPVTVPVFSLTVPAEALAMLPTNPGSWNSTGPAGRSPETVSVTACGRRGRGRYRQAGQPGGQHQRASKAEERLDANVMINLPATRRNPANAG
jgi:hypothetical protein